MIALALSPAGAAERLKTTPRTVRALILAGKLPAVDISTVPGKHRFQIASDDLEQFIEEKFSPPPTAKKRRRRRLPLVKEFV